MSITKQAAAQAIAVLEQLGYVDREADSGDARVKRLQVTPRGHEMMTLGEALFDEVRDRWAAQVGAGELDALQAHLAQLTARRSRTADDLL
jgi:DNA-binding MarR family transcriptional regulator